MPVGLDARHALLPDLDVPRKMAALNGGDPPSMPCARGLIAIKSARLTPVCGSPEPLNSFFSNRRFGPQSFRSPVAAVGPNGRKAAETLSIRALDQFDESFTDL